MYLTPLLGRLAVFVGLVGVFACGGRQGRDSGDSVEVEAAPVRSGPMLGYSTHREVAIWVQTLDDAQIQYRYWDVENPDEQWISPAALASEDWEYIVEMTLTGLEPGRTYGYELLVDGRPVVVDWPLEFVTQPLWEWRTDPPEFSVALGSCNYVNDAEWDRPGEAYGSGYEIFETIRQADPELMIWLGDNTYLREVDWDSRAMIFERHAHSRALPQLQPLLGSVHHYATWDDHDYGPNDADRSYVGKGWALEAFTAFWSNPTWGLPEVDGVFGQFGWADVDFFVLDERYYRSPREAPNDATKTMLGEAQLEWFIDALTASRAPFKVVISGSQFVNDAAHYETWARYEHERRVILDAIVERRIEGVVFVSGDRHHAELLRREEEGLYPIVDLTTSPLTAGLGDARHEQENPLRVPGTLVTDERNFAMLHFSGPRTERVMTMELRTADGEVRWSHTVSAAELSFGE